MTTKNALVHGFVCKVATASDTMCLIGIMEGRQRDTFRYRCDGITYNWHFVNMVLSSSKPSVAPIREQYVTLGGVREAAEYLWNLRQNVVR